MLLSEEQDKRKWEVRCSKVALGTWLNVSEEK
jgi:hypothetical protein